MKKNIVKIGLFALVLGTAIIARPSVVRANFSGCVLSDYIDSGNSTIAYISCPEGDYMYASTIQSDGSDYVTYNFAN